MKKEVLIIGTNDEGFKEIGKNLVIFFYVCLLTSISVGVGIYLHFILGILAFIIGLIPFMRRKK